MGLGNFLFGNRKEYNGRVDYYLRNEMHIDTNNNSNPNFPGVLAYLREIDKAWHSKMTAEELASTIAFGLFSGMKDNRCFKSSDTMNEMKQCLIAFVSKYAEAGKIRVFISDGIKKRVAGEMV